MTPVVTPVRVYVQHGVDRDLTLGTEHVSRLNPRRSAASDRPHAVAGDGRRPDLGPVACRTFRA